MARSSRIWVPYPTYDDPIADGDLPEWDSIIINNTQLPIDGVPRYAKHLERDKKKGPGKDNHKLTAKGVKALTIHITLKLWVDIGNGSENYLEKFRRLLPTICPPRYDRRYAIPVYHPVLAEYGVTSILFTNTPTPQHVGNRVFHVELEGENGADVKNGASTATVKKPNTNALSAQPALRGGKFGTVVQTIPRVDGTSVTTAWQGRINTPSTRSGAP